MNHSLIFFGQPRMDRSARGAPILANLSMKSQIGSPPIGRISAVKNPQKAIHSTNMRTGLTKIKTARVTSTTPIMDINFTAISGDILTAVKYLIQPSLP